MKCFDLIKTIWILSWFMLAGCQETTTSEAEETTTSDVEETTIIEAEQNPWMGKNGSDIFAAVPKEDHPEFSRYNYGIALTEKSNCTLRMPRDIHITNENFQVFEILKVPLNFSLDLLDFCQQVHDLNDDDIYNWLLSPHGQICKTPQSCIDPGDIGSLCCPF